MSHAAICCSDDGSAEFVTRVTNLAEVSCCHGTVDAVRARERKDPEGDGWWAILDSNQ